MKTHRIAFVAFALLALGPAGCAPLSVTIAYPTMGDAPPTAFTASGSTKPDGAALYARVVLAADPEEYWEGEVVQGAPDWRIAFEGLPAGVPLVLYVFASDGERVVFTSVAFSCGEGKGKHDTD